MPVTLPTFDALCHGYMLATDALPQGLSTQLQSSLLITLAWGSLHARQRAPAHVQAGLWACWRDHRLTDLHPRQRYLLLWFGAVTVAAWELDEDWARGVVARTYLTARSVWTPSAWQPWMGPRPELRPRVRVMELPDVIMPADPSGDPEPELSPVGLEGSSTAWSWFSVGQILDGLDCWGATLQDHLRLPLGDMLRWGTPSWERFMKPLWHAGEFDTSSLRPFRLAA